MMMLKKWIVPLLSMIFISMIFISMMFMLSACRSPVYNQTEGNIADVRLKAVADRHQFDAAGKPQPSLLVKSGLYVDTTPISIEREPRWLKYHLIIRGDQLPFSYYSRTIASGANTTVLTKYQVGLESTVNVNMNYSGTIKGALDLLAAKTGYVYSIHGNRIYWQAFVTKTFDIAFMPGDTDYLVGKKSGAGATSASSTAGTGGGGQVANYTTSDTSDSEYSNIKGTLSIWKDLDATIKQLLSPDGKMMVSESTTSVTVRDRPTNVALIGQYINNMNRNLSKQVLVKVQVLEVSLENGYDFGINWNLVVKSFHNSKFIVNGNYGTPVSITALTSQSPGSTPIFGNQAIDSNIIPAYNILFNALNQQGKTSIVTEPRVVCLNNQVSVIRIVEAEGYAASIQNTALPGTSTASASQNTVTSQVTPGTLVTGLTLYILPKILNDRIYIQVNADLSSKEALTAFGPTNSQIQLPKVSVKHFNQRSMIHSGDTLILSGFRQIFNTAKANQFLKSQALGGKASQELNKETIVLITPFILNGSA